MFKIGKKGHLDAKQKYNLQQQFICQEALGEVESTRERPEVLPERMRKRSSGVIEVQ